jgi:hypothetical protein
MILVLIKYHHTAPANGSCIAHLIIGKAGQIVLIIPQINGGRLDSPVSQAYGGLNSG